VLYTLIYREVDIKFSFEFSLDSLKIKGENVEVDLQDLVSRIKSKSLTS
jgi:hypothetical protein